MSLFVEKQFVEEEFWHWKYQFAFTDEIYYERQRQNLEREIFDWCISNLTNMGGWHIRNQGVIILNEEDALIFKLAWC